MHEQHESGRRKLGPDGLTKDQRYYRRNAEQVKKRVKARRTRLKGDPEPEEPRTIAAMVQTDPTPTPMEHLESLIAVSNKICHFFIHDGLDTLCFQGKRQLLELRSQVEQWCCMGCDLSSWNRMAEGSVQDAERYNDLDYLKPVLFKLEEKKVAGEYLLHQLNTWTIDEYPSNIADALIAFKARSELFVYVARVLGFTERWIGILNDRLGRVVVGMADDLVDEGEECIIEAELLSDT